jgi:hypothetical protein
MPEHFHLLMREPQEGNPSTVMQKREAALCAEGDTTTT